MERRNIALVAALVAFIATPQAAHPESARLEAALKNPPIIGRQFTKPGDRMLAAPRDLFVALSVEYRDGQMWNPSTNRFDRVRLRSYVSKETETPHFLGPTIVARPGDTLRLRLTNNLPADDPSCLQQHANINIPHCFNSTNLHMHGLWVSPAGNSDNVFLTFKPGISFEHEYSIPVDHPAGTFWYHPHLHGSTALQVSSGMGGALILRGDRMPTPDRAGDLDVLLRPTPAQPFPERIMVFQQIAYACRDSAGRIKTEPADDDNGRWVCDKDDIGKVERYLGPVPPNEFGAGVWVHSERHTSINGDILPVLHRVKVGQFERWRMIHAGVRDTINLVVRKLTPNAGSVDGLSTQEMYDYVARNCVGSPVPLHLVAADGLTMRKVHQVSNAVMQPGYRWDALVAFREPGTYCLIDSSDPTGGGMDIDNPHAPRLMGTIVVERGTALKGTASEALTTALVAAARQNIAGPMATAVAADLNKGLQLSAFASHPDLTKTKVDGEQVAVFNIDLTTNPVRYEINGKVFDPTNIRRVTLGAVEDWILSSHWEGHPHHIHVNPFQVISVLDPNGNDVSEAGAVDDYSGEPDNQFAGMKGVWKDTIWVKNPKKAPDGAYTIRVRTQYTRYIGEFVFHCHILDHEDQGMMEAVSIGLPGMNITPVAVGRDSDHR